MKRLFHSKPILTFLFKDLPTTNRKGVLDLGLREAGQA